MNYPLLAAVMLTAGTLTAFAADEAKPAPGTACKYDKGTCEMPCKPGKYYGKHWDKAHVGYINTTGLYALIYTKTPLVLLDARTGKFDDGQRLPGAGTLSPEATDAEIATYLPNKDALIVTYCANPKCPASGTLAERLVKLGYKYVLTYPYGIDGWVAAGYTVEKAN